MEALFVVLLYILCTVPFLVLLLVMHSMNSDYTKLFMIALVLQLVPIGLIFFPLGVLGVALLFYTLHHSGQRLRQFRASGLFNPEVQQRWGREYFANLIAVGFALEQKGVAWLFMEVTSRKGFGFLWNWLLPESVLLWLILGGFLLYEQRQWKRLGSP